MKRFLPLLILTGLLLGQNSQGSKPPSIVPTMYVVEIIEAYIEDGDFKRSTFGVPLPINLVLWENGEVIWAVALGKKRGYFEFTDGNTAILSYHPESTYRVTIKDASIIADEGGMGGNWDKGLWPFNDLDKNRLHFENGSWIEFGSHAIPNMKYRPNKL